VLKQLKVFEKNRVFIDQMLLKLPGIGKAILHREIARFCRTLSLLLSYGIPIRDAIGTTVPTLGNRLLEKDLRNISHDLTLGLSVYQSFSKIKIFPGFVLSLISVGEEGGKLDDAFAEIAHAYERELDTEIKIFSALIEPILILSIGLVIGFIVMAMLLPIFDLNLR
jgi:type II secretory pathway component PulF